MSNARSLSAALLSSACLVTAIPQASAEMSSAVRMEERSIAGLDEAAEIIIDFWGIPHIYAANDRDALFLQGYNAARDRLWQIDLWRKRGLGLLAENFGPTYVEQDTAARLFLYEGDMDAEWAAYGDKAKGYTEAFVEGLNAYVQEVLDGERDLPVQFAVSGTEPDLWQPEDVVRIRSHGLTRNAASEVRRAQVTCAAGLEADALRAKLEPEWETEVPEGLDPCVIPADVMATYDLGTRPVSFDTGAERDAALEAEEFLRTAEANTHVIGSNNWVVAPERTSTGRPLLANDPHRAHGVPSLRYIVHLQTPGMSVIGAGEPSLPGISIGHNGKIAFGLTIFAIDQEDLYVYELNPDNPNQYRYQDGWEDMRVVEETIEVKNGEPQTVELRYTRHGPVLSVDEANGRAFAMRTVWLEPGTSAYFGSSDYMTAQNWDEFRAAMDRFATPSENQVYADTEGNIGWIAAGMTPARDNWDGLMPVPGDGRYEWDFFQRSDLPDSFNPEKGWFATANQMNLPDDYPIDEKRIGFEWSDPSRYQRLEEVLNENSEVSLQDAMQLQTDDVSPLARRMVALYQGLELPESASENVGSALEMLQGWDAEMAVDSGAAVIHEILARGQLGRATVAVAVPEAAREIIDEGSIGAVLDLLEEPDERLGDDPATAKDGILVESLSAAVAEIEELLGDDPQAWEWGTLHRALFVPDVAPLLSDTQREEMSVGPLAMAGSGSTPRAASYRDDFTVSSGASFRMVLDVGNWDASRTINTPGQSGDPTSPHYRDLAPLWAAGDYVPLLYSRELVEANAKEVISLEPAQ